MSPWEEQAGSASAHEFRAMRRSIRGGGQQMPVGAAELRGSEALLFAVSISVLLPCTVSVALSSTCPLGALARHTYTPCAPCASSGILQEHRGHTQLRDPQGAAHPPHRPARLTAAPRPARCAGGAAPRHPSATPAVPAGLTHCRRTQPCCPPLSPGFPASPARPGHRRHHRRHLCGM